MKNIAFHSNELTIRGTEVALYDYAHYNETILQNKSYIIASATGDLTTLKKFTDRFTVFLYHDFKECEQFISKNNIEYIYFIKSGFNDGKVVTNAKNLIHAVFQYKVTHGDVHAYVSNWLAKKMQHPLYVPHIVTLPEPTKNIRDQFGFSKQSRIFGRYGGYNEFDIPFVKRSIINIVNKYDDIKFVFMNTKPFYTHPSILYIEGTSNVQNKSNFIAACDAMIHARFEGESFGLAIAEFLYHNKPVFAWMGGSDQNHLTMLDSNTIYTNEKDLEKMLLNKLPEYNFRESVLSEFQPIPVMNKFNEVFLT